MGLRNGRHTVFFLLVTKTPDRYRFRLNRLKELSYSRCVPLWRAPAGTRTHVSGNCWVRLSQQNQQLSRKVCLSKQSTPNLRHGKQTLVPSQHPRPWHRLRAAGHRVLLVDSDHPYSGLCDDPEVWMGPPAVSGEGQVLRRRLKPGHCWRFAKAAEWFGMQTV